MSQMSAAWVTERRRDKNANSMEEHKNKKGGKRE
jgi:hypothetical protein